MNYEGYFRYRDVSTSVDDNYIFPRYLLDVFPGDRSTRILDIGCGFGHILRALHGNGYEKAEGVDVSFEAVEHCIDSGLKVTRITDLTQCCEEQREPAERRMKISRGYFARNAPQILAYIAGTCLGSRARLSPDCFQNVMMDPGIR